MKNCAFGHGAVQHFLQANRLRGELDVVVQLLPLGAVFELDGVYHAVLMELDQIGLADDVRNFAKPARKARLASFSRNGIRRGAGLLYCSRRSKCQ